MVEIKMDALIEIFKRIEIYKWIIIISTILSVLPKNGKWIKYDYVIFIFMVFFCELIFTHYARPYIWPTNYPAYNIYTIVVCVGYMYFFLNSFREHRYFYAALAICLIWLITSVYFFFEDFDPMKVNIRAYHIGLLLSACLAFWYVYDLIFIQPFKNIFQQPLFYLALGIILFYFSAFLILNFIHLMVANENASTAIKEILQKGNIILSLGYLGMAICMRKEI